MSLQIQAGAALNPKYLGLAAKVEAALNGDPAAIDEIERLLSVPNIQVKVLAASAAVVAGQAVPVLLDFGACPDGRIWDVDLVTVYFKDPWTVINGLTAVDAASALAAAANNVSLPAVPGQTNSVSGFEITGTGATAGSTIVVTLTGIVGGTASYDLVIPAGAGLAVNSLLVEFPVAIQATGPNVAITLNVPSFGAGNLNATAAIHGFVSGGNLGAVSGALFVGSPPSVPNTANFNPADVQAVNLQVPGSASFAVRRPMVRNKQHIYTLINGPGLAALAGNFFGICLCSTVPDTAEALTWL
jgi:hypothetical protein